MSRSMTAIPKTSDQKEELVYDRKRGRREQAHNGVRKHDVTTITCGETSIRTRFRKRLGGKQCGSYLAACLGSIRHHCSVSARCHLGCFLALV